MIDHTLLRQTATKDEIKKLCAEAVEYGFGAVCVQPVYVSACYSYLRKAPDVKIAPASSGSPWARTRRRPKCTRQSAPF